MSEFERFKQGLQESRKEAYVKYPIQTGEDCTEHVWGLAHSPLRDLPGLGANPLEEIRALRSVDAVLKRDVVYERSEYDLR